MKKENREFWITDPLCYSEDYIHTNEEEAVQCGDFIIHVIEYSAVEKLQKENEEIKRINKLLNDENNVHIKLLEKINDWAIAGNIENYSQLCDELEKIQENR